MIIKSANCMCTLGKIKIKLAQQPHIMRTYKLRYHVERLVDDEVTGHRVDVEIMKSEVKFKSKTIIIELTD
jgi:hypothetical protein